MVLRAAVADTMLRYVQVVLPRRSFSCHSRKLDEVRAQWEEVATLTAAKGSLLRWLNVLQSRIVLSSSNEAHYFHAQLGLTRYVCGNCQASRVCEAVGLIQALSQLLTLRASRGMTSTASCAKQQPRNEASIANTIRHKLGSDVGKSLTLGQVQGAQPPGIAWKNHSGSARRHFRLL